MTKEACYYRLQQDFLGVGICPRRPTGWTSGASKSGTTKDICHQERLYDDYANNRGRDTYG